jgi:hypothetical protein
MGALVGGIIFGAIVLIAMIGLSVGSRGVAEDKGRRDPQGHPTQYEWHDPTL